MADPCFLPAAIEKEHNVGKRIRISLIAGAVLGVFCIVGGSVRGAGGSDPVLYFLALWYNRVLMGLAIGLAGGWQLVDRPWNLYLRGAVLGLLVSLAFFLSTGVTDVVSFLAGVVYGVLIDWAAQRWATASRYA
jgi:hypothetical protein